MHNYSFRSRNFQPEIPGIYSGGELWVLTYLNLALEIDLILNSYEQKSAAVGELQFYEA
ncbi:hypothetical protein NWP22_06555 [Anabaenopsis tanganyikae CS-531]|uniref:Uncharacterized protein n=2 Tax=Anabaenopsis TaxID=110103 RepID=A0ABT5AU06_9CYAN|nr:MULTISPECIES: hypothetical protein [Anabaenopsis]MDB9540422.1 hypothetical protein [Anabaenopsis arnoldii]MDH6092820.1 hypothetical protein [Anabaenopsis arnoldii]MDH6105530.1 hypothetical protein [Anabaenopsis tanganyikae CS-531]